MRILIVSQFFWPENLRINDLSAGLIERGHQVTVLTGIPNYPDGRFYSGYGFLKKTRQSYHGVEIIRVPLIPRGRGGRFELFLNYSSFVFFGTLLAPFVCRGAYDAIFVFAGSPILMAIPAIFLSKIRKIPLVVYVLDLWPETISAVGMIKAPFILRSLAKVVRFIYKHSDKILVPSPGLIEPIKAMGIDESHISFWPQWAEDSYQMISPKTDSPEAREMPSGFRIMFAGNVGTAQSFKTIIEAAEKLKDFPNIHWIILGEGSMKSWVENEVRSRVLNNNVHLLGKRPLELMSNYFAYADVALVSLKRDPIFARTIPAKIQSYMACGRPILACLDGVGAQLVRESGAGISCPAEDSSALAEKVLYMYKLTDAQRHEMGISGQLYCQKHFARNNLLNQFEKWVHELERKTI